MKSIYLNYINDELWLIKETEWARSLQNIRESQFALGNGYLGTRGVYEEIPYDCIPGTYISGLYDKMSAQVSELINLPNPVNFKFSVKGEKLDLVAMDIIDHKRVLNMKKAVLCRHTVYKDSKGGCYDYQSMRFISQHNKNIGVMQISLTPLDQGCVVDVNTGIDTSVSNAGILSEGRKKHFRIRELGQNKEAGYLILETFEKKYMVIYWAGFYFQTNGKKTVAADNVFRLKLKKNQTVVFTKIFFLKHYACRDEYSSYKKEAYNIFKKCFKTGFSDILQKHIKAWEKLWRKADIRIEGTANLQQNMRFNIYHMLICGHCDQGFSSIGARTLSGEGYRGHVFWDAEIFLLPFYIFTFPKIARNMLIYRYKRLAAAKEIAKNNGYKGAQFPWESADTGREETPEWARDIDRTIIKIYTHKMEHHITADIAYALYKYYLVTGDEKFMEDYGFEIMVECARFWASRAEYSSKTKKYEIRGVIGPDEFHINVDNNAFTNVMAKWNLITAAKLLNGIKNKKAVYYKIKNKVKLKEKEAAQWRQVASKISLNADKEGVIEQFDNYFRLKKVPLRKTDENGILLLPFRMKTRSLAKTQIIKQADVLMLLCLLDDVFSPATKKANYDFYIKRTVHKSSLSAPMHAFIASKTGDLQRAYNFFNVALRTDISNLYGNTYEGIHAASLGGTWQTVVFGFAGVVLKRDVLFINPCMPRSWRKLVFSLNWRNSVVDLELTNNSIKLKVISSKREKNRIGIFNKIISVENNKVFTFKRHTCQFEEEYY